MRMLLTSSGPTNPVLVDALAALVGRPFEEARIGIVLTASLVLPGDKGWVIESIERLRRLGWAQIDLVELQSGPAAGIEERLLAADVVYVGGGNHYFLADVIRTRGLQPLFRAIVDTKVYVGESAGSMIFTPLLGPGADAMQDRADMISLGIDAVEPAVALFDWYLKPHLGSPWFPERTDEWAAERADRLGAPVWFLDDDTALLVRDPAETPSTVSAGRWLRLGG